jgi:hypothetical protein
MQTAAASKPYRVDVRDSLEGTDSPGRLSICGIAGSANHGKIASRNRLIRNRDLRAEKARSRSKRSFGIFRIEKMSEKGFAGSSRTIIGGNKSIGMSESPATN